MCIIISYRQPNNGAIFGVWTLTVCWMKFYGGFGYLISDATFLKLVGFSHTVVTAQLYTLFRDIANSDY
jgi:hypothetical protein